jgi:hypothetical protein
MTKPGFFIPQVINYPSTDYDADTYSEGRVIGGDFLLFKKDSRYMKQMSKSWDASKSLIKVFI